MAIQEAEAVSKETVIQEAEAVSKEMAIQEAEAVSKEMAILKNHMEMKTEKVMIHIRKLGHSKKYK